MSSTTYMCLNKSVGSNINKSSYNLKRRNMKKRLVTRHKVLVIPYYIVSPGCCKLVLVQDSRTKEWGFISGGIKMYEQPLEAAKRELNEETSSTISFPNKTESFNFISLYRPREYKIVDYQRNEIVRSMYTVYKFEINESQLINMKTFFPNKEVINIACDFYNNFDDTWGFCDDVFETYLNKKL